MVFVPLSKSQRDHLRAARRMAQKRRLAQQLQPPKEPPLPGLDPRRDERRQRPCSQRAIARRLKAALRKERLNARDRERFTRDLIQYVFSKPRPRCDAAPAMVRP
jgi:hypothetical protein